VGGGTWKTIPTNTDHGEYSCAIKSDDTLWCWGRNTWYILGTGSSASVNVPTQVSGGGNWSVNSLSKGSTALMGNCALKTDATLWCWGWSAFGVKLAPTKVSSVVTWKKVDISWQNGCAKDNNDVLWCWGQGGSGGVGDGTGITRTAVTLVEIR
jgi:alpha-tubulin suppressor-like RCC1 family protein